MQTLHLKQFDLSSPGFQLFWLKISLPHATKYICTLYRSPNTNSHELLFDHLSKSIETITLQSPPSEIIALGDFNIHKSDWFSYSSNVTNPAGREAEAFAIVNDLTQVISEPTRVPDRAGDKANTLDLFLTSNPSIYSPPTVSSPLGNSDHCLITSLPTLLAHFPPRGNKPTSFVSQKRVTECNPLIDRPIAITLLTSKAIATITTKQPFTFLEKHNLLSDHQNGFRKARSTGDLLGYAVHVWSSPL